MTISTFQTEIEDAVSRLIDMARERTYTTIPDNYKFILTEISDSDKNLHAQSWVRKRANDKKIPVALSELMPSLQSLYHNLYDINLHIYRTTKNLTTIDFRYYTKSSLDPDYREKVLGNPPMLHCKIACPPWLGDKKGKFDINWEHYEGLNRLRLFRLKLIMRMRLI